MRSLLYPFSWPHTYIPVLPDTMLDICCSPTPYIIGIMSSHLQKVLNLPLSEVSNRYLPSMIKVDYIVICGKDLFSNVIDKLFNLISE
jgi:hypothetical protein